MVLLLAIVLAGCRVDVRVATTMQADGSGQVALTVTCDADVVAKRPEVLSDLRLDDAKAAGWTVTAPARTPDGGATVTLTKPFRTPAEGTKVLAEISGPQGPLRDLRLAQNRSFARVASSFSGTAQLAGDLAAFSDAALSQQLGAVPLADLVTPQQLTDGLRLQVTTQLPGAVTSSSGTTGEGGAVTWSVTPGGPAASMTVAATHVDQGALDARNQQHRLLAAAGGWVVLVLLLAGGWWLWRARHRGERGGGGGRRGRAAGTTSG